MNAPCESEPELWFADGKSNATKEARKTAIATCASCPLREPCLQLAMDAEQGIALRHRFGIFGGKTTTERWEADGRPGGTTPKRHGTNAGYWRHRSLAEDPCKRCKQAHVQAEKDRLAERAA